MSKALPEGERPRVEQRAEGPEAVSGTGMGKTGWLQRRTLLGARKG